MVGAQAFVGNNLGGFNGLASRALALLNCTCQENKSERPWGPLAHEVKAKQ